MIAPEVFAALAADPASAIATLRVLAEALLMGFWRHARGRP